MSRFYSKINKFIDNLKFDKHRNFKKKIKVIKKNRDINNTDYGSGYFYQSLKNINLSGLRNTSYRVKKLGINKYITNKKILDIGTNCGSILFELEANFYSALGVDHNKNDIKIANLTKKYLNKQKIVFLNQDFLKLSTKYKFDVILSLANHNTYDKGVVDSNLYINKILKHLNEKGIIFLKIIVLYI